MKIFASGANNIINIISKFKNNTIDKKELNRNILSSIIYNYCYFKKNSKKLENEKNLQNQLFQNFLSQEEKQIKNEKIYLAKERNKIRREELFQKFNNERKLMLDSYKEKKPFTKIIEPTFDCYIPTKQLCIPLEFYENKIVSNIFDQEENETNEKENDINKINEEENKKDVLKGNNNYDINFPIHLCEDNEQFFDDNFFDDNNEENNKEKKEEDNNKDFLDILNTDDNLLFYEDEKLDMKRQKSSKIKTSNKKLLKANTLITTNEEFELDKNLSKNEIVENHYKEFSYYLPLSIYTKYIKKMNYVYLHLMLMNYFDLEYKINNGLDLYKETIIVNYVKKIILESGICSNQIYEKIIKNVLIQKDNYSFETYLTYFSPVFKASEEYQSFKYKYLLYLSKNKYSEIMTQLEFDMFLNLVKGKIIYDKETYSDLIKRFKVIYKKQYPSENQKYYYYSHVNAIIEFIIDLNYENLSD
jgi:hypothetical protein